MVIWDWGTRRIDQSWSRWISTGWVYKRMAEQGKSRGYGEDALQAGYGWTELGVHYKHPGCSSVRWQMGSTGRRSVNLLSAVFHNLCVPFLFLFTPLNLGIKLIVLF